MSKAAGYQGSQGRTCVFPTQRQGGCVVRTRNTFQVNAFGAIVFADESDKVFCEITRGCLFYYKFVQNVISGSI